MKFCYLVKIILWIVFSFQSPENAERKTKVVEYEKEKTSKADRKRVRLHSVSILSGIYQFCEELKKSLVASAVIFC